MYDQKLTGKQLLTFSKKKIRHSPKNKKNKNKIMTTRIYNKMYIYICNGKRFIKITFLVYHHIINFGSSFVHMIQQQHSGGITLVFIKESSALFDHFQ